MLHDLTVIILTHNEERNLAHVLESVGGWARHVFIVDSDSTDATVAIAERHGCRVFEKTFKDYSSQRNWALDTLPIQSEWIFMLDADEWVPQGLREEISGLIASNPAEAGFCANRRFIWMGRWIKRGYYPAPVLRLFRRGAGRCEERGVNEHIMVSGPIGRLKSDFIHEDHKPLADWIQKHNRYAKAEAAELLRKLPDDGCVQGDLFGEKSERVRWLRYKIYNRLPPLIRPVMYFFYRYVLQGGFLDGWQGLTYHFLQALWFPVLIDLNYLELKQQRDERNPESVSAKAANSH